MYIYTPAEFNINDEIELLFSGKYLPYSDDSSESSCNLQKVTQLKYGRR